MAVVIKEGNVFDSDAKIICHQVNCQGVMGVWCCQRSS